MSEDTLRLVKEEAARRASTVKDVCSACDLREVSEKLADTRKRGHLGKTLIKTGIALIAVPDPVTDVPGAAIAAAGLLVSRFSDCVGMQDLESEARRTFAGLEELSI